MTMPSYQRWITRLTAGKCIPYMYVHEKYTSISNSFQSCRVYLNSVVINPVAEHYHLIAYLKTHLGYDDGAKAAQRTMGGYYKGS